MKFILKLHPEITIKSKSVRQRFIKLLEGNVRNVLRRIDENVKVDRNWTQIEVRAKEQGDAHRLALVDSLKSTPGINQILEVVESTYKDVDDIYQQTLPLVKDQIEGKTFCVRVKRSGKHEFSSGEVERYVGGGLNQNVNTAGVKLSKPEATVRLEIQQDRLFIVTHHHKGLGGMPIASQEDVLSLISGGFDSGVSSFETIRRGSRTHFLFFNLGGAAHEIGVKQVAYHLWRKYSSSHKTKFITVDFEPIVAEILENIDNGQMGVILKRMMMRVGAMVAERTNIQALVTGECLGQVSSQTLTNLNVIDRVTDTLILRPLITQDKQSIINVAREIGTAEISETIPEYCGVISNKPTVKAVLSKIEEEEAKFNFDLIEQVVLSGRIIDARTIKEEMDQEVDEVHEVKEMREHDENSVVIDIRSVDEVEEKPLQVDGVEVLHIPFFKLSAKFPELDQEPTYMLYCDRGVMSKLQALYLHDAGYANVAVYKP